MIRNEIEYKVAVQKLQQERERFEKHREHLEEEMGLTPDEMKRALDPLYSFHEQLSEEIESYERLKRGEFWEVVNFDGLGRLLIALRIAKGTTQRQLAELLGVHESQVSRDERNEYHGATLDRIDRILGVLRTELRSVVTSVNVVPMHSNPLNAEHEQPPIEQIRLQSTPIMAKAASFQPPSNDQIIKAGQP